MEHRRDGRRLARSLAVALVSVALASCGSGRHPDTGGVDPSTYMARFSGQWALDEDVSEDPSPFVAALEQQLEGFDEAGQPRPGGRGGAVGRRGGGGLPLRTGPDPDAIRATLEIFRSVPQRYSLSLGDSVVVTTWVGAEEGRMGVAGDGISTTVRGQPGDASVEWDGGRLRIEHRVVGGGTVVDLFEAFADRPRLLVTRRLEGLGLGGSRAEHPTVRLAYDLVEGR